MIAQPWPKGPTFRKFAALIADGVMFAQRVRLEFGPHAGCCCPEGAVLAMLSNALRRKAEIQGDGSELWDLLFEPSGHPTTDEFCQVLNDKEIASALQRERLGPQQDDLALLFAEGFDGEPPEIKPRSFRLKAAYRLGQEYRRRFVEGA